MKPKNVRYKKMPTTAPLTALESLPGCAEEGQGSAGMRESFPEDDAR